MTPECLDSDIQSCGRKRIEAQNVQIRHSSRRTSSARVNVRQALGGAMVFHHFCGLHGETAHSHPAFGEASFRLEIQSVDAFVKSCAFGVGETEVSWIEMLWTGQVANRYSWNGCTNCFAGLLWWSSSWTHIEICCGTGILCKPNMRVVFKS